MNVIFQHIIDTFQCLSTDLGLIGDKLINKTVVFFCLQRIHNMSYVWNAH